MPRGMSTRSGTRAADASAGRLPHFRDADRGGRVRPLRGYAPRARQWRMPSRPNTPRLIAWARPTREHVRRVRGCGRRQPGPLQAQRRRTRGLPARSSRRSSPPSAPPSKRAGDARAAPANPAGERREAMSDWRRGGGSSLARRSGGRRTGNAFPRDVTDIVPPRSRLILQSDATALGATRHHPRDALRVAAPRASPSSTSARRRSESVGAADREEPSRTCRQPRSAGDFAFATAPSGATRVVRGARPSVVADGAGQRAGASHARKHP